MKPLSNCARSGASRRLAPIAALMGTLIATGAYATDTVISTTGNGHQTVSGDGDTLTIQTGGAISTSANGINGSGVYSTGNTATITNSGSISTSGGGSPGVVSTGASSVITNSGSITTSGQPSSGFTAVGMRSDGASSTINNSGSISTSGGGARGVVSSGASSVITNSGSITTSGQPSSGLNAVGVRSEGASSTINNSGSITTLGQQAHGAYLDGASSTITNSGSISTSGAGAVGVISFGTSATITNSGSIFLLGQNGNGVVSTGATAIITNSGSISSSQVNVFGVLSTGASATITNSGSIQVTGATAVGIYSVGSNGTINVSGLVSATGAATQAIVGDKNQTLNLLPGARIAGTIDLGSGTNAVNITTGAGPSTTLTISNAGIVSHSGPSLVVTGGNVISVVDTTSFTAAQSSLGNTSDGIVQAINNQLSHPASSKPIRLVANEVTPEMVNLTLGPTAWAHLLGSQTNQDSTSTSLAYKDNSYGVIGGYEQTLSEHRVGFFGGVSHTDTNTNITSSKMGSDSVFGGVYGQYVNGVWKFNGSVTLGYSNNASQRTVTDNLAGVQTGVASFNSTFVSPSVGVARDFDIGTGWKLSPSAEVSYTYDALAGYTESGTANSNLTVGSRAATATSTRLQLAARKLLDGACGDYELRLGAINRDYGGDNVTANLQGSPTSTFGLSGTPSATGAFVGAGGRVEFRKQLDLVADVQYTQYSGNSNTVSGYVGMEYRY